MLSILDRAQGALLGLAIGDALGTTLEFTTPGAFTPIDDMVGGGPFGLEPGQWTDDTSMALCLGHSLLHCQGGNPEDQMRRYVNWRDQGYMSVTGACFDIGNTTSQALTNFLESGNPYAGSTDPYAAGNGSLMRLAPIPLFYHQNPVDMLTAAAQSSRTTHGARTCLDACRYFAGLIWLALHATEKAQLLASGVEPVAGAWENEALAPEIKQVVEGSFRQKNPPEIKGSGYVVDSMEAALWAFFHSQDFRSGALLAVNLGDDADTTGAIYGQIAGAYYGLSGIPVAWRERVWWKNDILELASQLLAATPEL